MGLTYSQNHWQNMYWKNLDLYAFLFILIYISVIFIVFCGIYLENIDWNQNKTIKKAYKSKFFQYSASDCTEHRVLIWRWLNRKWFTTSCKAKWTILKYPISMYVSGMLGIEYLFLQTFQTKNVGLGEISQLTTQILCNLSHSYLKKTRQSY